MPKIIRKYLNNRIKKSRILPPKHELYSPLKTGLDCNQVVQGLPWPVSDRMVPLRERPLRLATICECFSFEVWTLLLVGGSKEGEGVPHLPMFFSDLALHSFPSQGNSEEQSGQRGSAELSSKPHYTELSIRLLS